MVVGSIATLDMWGLTVWLLEVVLLWICEGLTVRLLVVLLLWICGV